jgi:ankyrin repeat protein
MLRSMLRLVCASLCLPHPCFKPFQLQTINHVHPRSYPSNLLINNTMVTPDTPRDHEVASCSDENTDLEAFSQYSSEDGETYLTHGSCKNPTWQTQWPLQYSMNPSVKAAGNPEEPLDHTKCAIYQDTAILDTSGGRGKTPFIRLLRIQTGTGTGPICCELVKRPLWDAGIYSALSYSWGTEPPLDRVFVGSRNTSRVPFPVSPHLFSALKRLRSVHSVTDVWIDAICINQSNVLERSAQVQIMAQIFNAASEVRVWLGEYSGSQDNFHEADCELFWSLCQHPSPWWTRLWIIQECAYAAREPVIMLGACRMSFQQLIEQWQSAIRVSSDLISPDLGDTLTTNLEFLRMPFDAWKVQMVDGTHRVPLLQRLRETIGRRCSDPHDKIYALLSLIDEDEEKRLRPDYQKPFMDLMLEVSEVLRGHEHWDETRDCDLLDHFGLEPCLNTALTDGHTLQQYTKALEEASYRGYTKVIQALLDKCTGLIITKSHIGNALQAASEGGHGKVVQMLLDAGAHANAQGGKYGNALQAASARGHEKVVQMLLDAGEHVNAQRGEYGNALQAASEGGYEKVVQVLLDAGAHANAQGGKYGNALQAASARGHEKVVQMLLDAGADVNAQGGQYGNALQAASAGGDMPWAALAECRERVVQILLAVGADVNAQGGRYGNALQAASARGHEKVVQMLLDAGAHVNAQRGEYGNALQAASEGGYEKVVQVLLDAGAHVNAQGGKYGNALQAASARGHEKVVQMLLDVGAHVNAQRGEYSNALQAASEGGYEKVVQVLLDVGAHVNAQGGEYGNALQAASAGGDIPWATLAECRERVVQILLAAGADVNAQGGRYGNALQAASERGREKVVQVLIDAGADVNAQGGGYLRNALRAASLLGHEKVMQLLMHAKAK